VTIPPTCVKKDEKRMRGNQRLKQKMRNKEQLFLRTWSFFCSLPLGLFKVYDLFLFGAGIGSSFDCRGCYEILLFLFLFLTRTAG
jgi:prepilin signal peptidase PulO-like enzyme (type II secretory pathway)